jgi:hypothetical protein
LCREGGARCSHVSQSTRSRATEWTKRLRVSAPRPRIRPNTDGESNRGQQSQSIEPSRPTRAAVEPSPRRPYSPRGRKPWSRIGRPAQIRRSVSRIADDGDREGHCSGILTFCPVGIVRHGHVKSGPNCHTLARRIATARLSLPAQGVGRGEPRLCNGLSMIEARPGDTGAERRERD